MLVGKIWDSEYPWDVRVEKVCAALIAAGHDVRLVCRNRHHRAVSERIDGIDVRRMPSWDFWPAKVEAAATFPAFVNPRWLHLAYAAFTTPRVDVVLCRDLPLAPLALVVARTLKRPLVIDTAEHYPGLLRDLYNRHDFKVRNLVIRNPWVASLLERLVLPAADGVLVVVQESADRLARLGVRPERITVVSNTTVPRRVELMRKPARNTGRGPTCIRLVYLGKVETSRGLLVALDGLAELRQRSGGSNVQLDVFGDGSGLSAAVARARALAIDDQVTFHGHRPYETVLTHLPEYDAGLIPHHANDHWNYTIQNKLFDYMAAGLPVLVSSMHPAERIVKETGCGLVFRDRDPVSFADAVLHLRDDGRAVAWGRAGRRAVAERYNWAHDAARLVKVVEMVHEARRGSKAP